MRIRRTITLTVLDDVFRETEVSLTLRPCAYCPRGTQVYRGTGTDYDSHIGHVALGRFVGPAAMVSGGCPGDVSLSTRYGIIRKAPYRTAAFMRGLRSLVRTSLG